MPRILAATVFDNQHPSNLRLFRSVRAPPNGGGRPHIVSPIMLDTLCACFSERPYLYLNEMLDFLWNSVDFCVLLFRIS